MEKKSDVIISSFPLTPMSSQYTITDPSLYSFSNTLNSPEIPNYSQHGGFDQMQETDLFFNRIVGILTCTYITLTTFTSTAFTSKFNLHVQGYHSRKPLCPDASKK